MIQHHRPLNPLLCNLSAAIFAIVVVAPFWYLLTDRDLPLRIARGEISPTRVVLGDTADVHWQMEVLRVCSGVVYRSLIDSQDTVWNSAPIKTRKSIRVGKLQFTREFQVPYGMALGPAKYQVTVLWKCNALQKYWPIKQQTPVLNFIVVPPEKPKAKDEFP